MPKKMGCQLIGSVRSPFFGSSFSATVCQSGESKLGLVQYSFKESRTTLRDFLSSFFNSSTVMPLVPGDFLVLAFVIAAWSYSSEYGVSIHSAFGSCVISIRASASYGLSIPKTSFPRYSACSLVTSASIVAIDPSRLCIPFDPSNFLW